MSLSGNKIWGDLQLVCVLRSFYICPALTGPDSSSYYHPGGPSRPPAQDLERVLFIENILMYFYVGLMNDKVLNRNKIYKQV